MVAGETGYLIRDTENTKNTNRNLELNTTTLRKFTG